MQKLDYPAPLRALISQFKRLPGIGPKSAERIVIWLLRGKTAAASELAAALAEAVSTIAACPECGFFSTRGEPCQICANPARDHSVLCIVEQPTDILPLERTGAFQGIYHTLGGKISPLENVGPDDLRLDSLYARIRRGGVREVILAVGSDVEGEATAHFIADALRSLSVSVTRIAQGLPAGGGLESADELTLFRALHGRRQV